MSDLAAYRTRIQNSLDDTESKYSTTVLDEALRKALNEYSRANPNFSRHTHTVVSASRTQTFALSDLITIVELIHPYISTITNPWIYEREDFILTYVDGDPTVYFSSGAVPAVDEKIWLNYASEQSIEDLDAAAATTVRDDHEDILIVGASGHASMMRASGLTESWGGRSGETSSLMAWGAAQYRRFLDFLAEIKQEVNLPIFPAQHWSLDNWDK